MKTIRLQATKEFLSLNGKETVYVDDIDYLVKEMTEEKSDV